MDASFGTSIGLSLRRTLHRSVTIFNIVRQSILSLSKDSVRHSVILLNYAWQIVGEVELPLSNPKRSRRAKGHSLVLQQYYSAHNTKLNMNRSVQSSTELL
jgi:hypothetical protein